MAPVPPAERTIQISSSIIFAASLLLAGPGRSRGGSHRPTATSTIGCADVSLEAALSTREWNARLDAPGLATHGVCRWRRCSGSLDADRRGLLPEMSNGSDDAVVHPARRCGGLPGGRSRRYAPPRPQQLPAGSASCCRCCSAPYTRATPRLLMNDGRLARRDHAPAARRRNRPLVAGLRRSPAAPSRRRPSRPTLPAPGTGDTPLLIPRVLNPRVGRN